MKMNGIGFAAVLLLSSATVGFAQGGPADEKGMEAPSRAGDGAARSQDEPMGGGETTKGDRGAEKSDQRASDRKSAGDEKADRATRAAEQPSAKREARDEKDGDQSQKKAASEKDGEQPSAKQAGSRDDTTQAKEQTKKPQKAETGTEPSQPQTAEGESKDTGKQAQVNKAKQVDLSGDKQEKVRSAFRGMSNVKHETNVNVDVSVGTRLPRHLHFQPLPTAVIEIVPEYRDYVFIYVDDRYVICDPDTYEVVAIIDERGEGGYRTTAARDGEGECSTTLTLTRDEEELLLTSISLKGEDEDVDDLRIGLTVPQSIELKPLPDPVLSRFGKLKGCQYFVAEDQIALVNPQDDKVVLLVEARD